MTFVAGGFFPARFTSHVPRVQAFTQAAVPTFLKGYPVVTTAGLLDECPAGTPMIAGIALADNSTVPGYSAANSPAPITGRSNVASIGLAINSTEFAGRLVNASDVTVAPTDADMGAQYGLSKQASGWAVDKNLVGADSRVIITGIDATNSKVYFRVLEAYQQYNN